MERHFTATVYVVKNTKFLLLYHPKHRKWLPPGGHLEANETPVACARREVLEETGLTIELIKDEWIWINQPNAMSCERPFMCLIENIPDHGDYPAHQHIDFIFLGYPTGGKLLSNDPEIQWLTLEEVMAFKPDVEIFTETQQTVAVLHSRLQQYTPTTSQLWNAIPRPDLKCFH